MKATSPTKSCAKHCLKSTRALLPCLRVRVLPRSHRTPRTACRHSSNRALVTHCFRLFVGARLARRSKQNFFSRSFAAPRKEAAQRWVEPVGSTGAWSWLHLLHLMRSTRLLAVWRPRTCQNALRRPSRPPNLRLSTSLAAVCVPSPPRASCAVSPGAPSAGAGTSPVRCWRARRRRELGPHREDAHGGRCRPGAPRLGRPKRVLLG